MRQRMHQHRHKLSHTIHSRTPHIQYPIIRIIEERVPIGIMRQLRIGRNLLSQEQGHAGMLAMRQHEVKDKAAEFVDDEFARADLVEVNGDKVAVARPFGVAGVDVTFA